MDPALPDLVAWSSLVLILYAGALSFAPALVAIVLAEAFGWRSVFYWLAIGGGIGLAAHLVTVPIEPLMPQGERAALYLGGGFVGGLVYWLIAGRLSGTPVPAERRSPVDRAEPPVDDPRRGEL